MNFNIDEYTFHERYVAFLMTAIPKLRSLTLISEGQSSEALKRSDVMAYAMSILPRSGTGLCLEFGVYQGGSLRFCAAQHPERRFYGFDSFEGFPTDGRTDWRQNFSTGGVLPDVPANVSLVKGWFSETLPSFLEEHNEQIDFLNIDCDIYSSTVDIFSALERTGRMRSGILVFFDELLNYSRWLWNESLAFFEMLERTGLGFEWICAHQKVRGVDETLRLLMEKNYPSWNDDLAAGYRQQAAVILTDNGPDYGPLHLPHYQNRVRELARCFQSLSGKP